jgi:hypothetical protein
MTQPQLTPPYNYLLVNKQGDLLHAGKIKSVPAHVEPIYLAWHEVVDKLTDKIARSCTLELWPDKHIGAFRVLVFYHGSNATKEYKLFIPESIIESGMMPLISFRQFPIFHTQLGGKVK